MTRRLAIILTLCLVVAAAAALSAWALTSASPAQMLVRQLNKDFNLEVTIHGRSTLSLLPRPRLKVENVEIRGIGGRLVIQNATFRGHIGWWSLLFGQRELSDVALRDGKTTLDVRGTDESFWSQWAAWMQLRNSVSPIRQFLTTNGSLRVLRHTHPDIVLTDINTAIDWPGNADPLSLTGSLRWNGETITIGKANVQPAALLSGRAGPFSVEVSALDSKLSAAGTVQLDRSRNVTFAGKSSFISASLRRLTQWADLPLPLSTLLEKTAFEGAFTTTRNVVSWPAVQITLGKSRFEGSLAFRVDAASNMISGTLATDDLDLTDYLAPLRTVAEDNTSLSYAGINRADLDLRLSIASGMIGTQKLSDIALGLIIKPDRLEATLSRASLENGTVKGRFLLTGSALDKEIRLQGNVDNIDITRFLPARTDGYVPLTGALRGQISLEGHGSDMQAVLKSSHGKLSISVANGEINGVNLPALATMRVDQPQLLQASNEKTRFATGAFAMPIAAGEGAFSDGVLQSNGEPASLQGQIDLARRTLTLKVTPRGSAAAPSPSLILSGPWRALSARLHPDDGTSLPR